MNSKERRLAILKELESTDKTIKGSTLAAKFGVTRQVIVQDIALLRAQGNDIIATPQGYMIVKKHSNAIRKTIVSQHKGYDDMQEELQIMIDHGARVLDVIVEHPVYGEIKGVLDISYKKELDGFMEGLKKDKAEPLSTLTEGIHIHTIEISDEDSFNKMKAALSKKGYLVKE